MKNIEKFAVDSIVAKFVETNGPKLEVIEEMRKALEDAKKNYMAAINPLAVQARNAIQEYKEELSPEALSYYETSIATTIKSQFKLQ